MLKFSVFWQQNAVAKLQQYLSMMQGPGARTLAQNIAQAIRDGNRDDRLRGVNRYGRPLVPLKSARKGKYEGAGGPPLAPFGDRSRVVTHFRATVGYSSNAKGFQVTAGWDPILSEPPRGMRARDKRGRYAGWNTRAGRSFTWKTRTGATRSRIPFLPFHLEGSGHNPKRDIAGISPKTWKKIQTLWWAWLDEATRPKK